jgi:MFS family permease
LTDRSLWREPDFVKLWSAQTISVFGTQVRLLAIPYTAVVLLGASPLAVGTLSAAGSLPFLLIGLPAGAWVDRLRRRPVMLVSDVARFLILAVVPVAYAVGALRLALLYPIALLTGVFTVFFDVAQQSYVPFVVDRDRLAPANAKLELSRSVAQVSGPGLGGLLVQALSAPVAVLVDALSYAGSAVFVLLVRRPEPLPERSGATMVTEIKEGVRFVLGHPLLRPILASMAAANLAFGGLLALQVLYLTRTLGLSADAIGLVLAIGYAGGVVGAFAVGPLRARFGVGRVLVGSVAVLAVAMVPVPLATHTTAVPLMGGGLFGVYLCVVTFNVAQISLRQAATPERLQGRMHSTMRMVVWGVTPIGAFLAGIVGQEFGLRTVMWLAVALNALAVVPLAASSVRTAERRVVVAETPGTGRELELERAQDDS